MHISILFSFLRNDTEITGLALQTLCNLLSADLQGKRRISILTELPDIKFCYNLFEMYKFSFDFTTSSFAHVPKKTLYHSLYK